MVHSSSTPPRPPPAGCSFTSQIKSSDDASAVPQDLLEQSRDGRPGAVGAATHDDAECPTVAHIRQHHRHLIGKLGLGRLDVEPVECRLDVVDLVPYERVSGS